MGGCRRNRRSRIAPFVRWTRERCNTLRYCTLRAVLAQSLGMPVERISDPDALGPALQRAFATPGPKLLDVIVDGRV